MLTNDAGDIIELSFQDRMRMRGWDKVTFGLSTSKEKKSSNQERDNTELKNRLK